MCYVLMLASQWVYKSARDNIGLLVQAWHDMPVLTHSPLGMMCCSVVTLSTALSQSLYVMQAAELTLHWSVWEI